MTFKDDIGLLSVLFACLGYGHYIWSIARHRTLPHAFSWIVWGTVMAVVFYAQADKGAGAGAWPTGASSLICYIIAVLSFFRGEKNITASDIAAFAAALAAIPVWLLTRDPLGSVILVTLIDGLGYVPTIRKSYDKPHQESVPMYAIDGIKQFLSLLALAQFSWTTALYPASVGFFDFAFVALVLWRRSLIKA